MQSRSVAASALLVLGVGSSCHYAWQDGGGLLELRNASDRTEEVALSRYSVPLECDATAQGSLSVSRGGLLEPVAVTMTSGEHVGLESDAEGSAICGAAVVSSARLPSALLITWDLRGMQGGQASDGKPEEEVPPGNVYLERFGRELRATVSAGMVVTEWRPEEAAP